MAAANINMLLNVQTSTANLAQVNKSIQRGVGTVELTFADKGLGKAKAQIQSVGDATKKASKDAKTFADAIALKGTSYAAYGVASQAILKLTGAISNATRESIRLEVELVKIAQTTNRSVASIKANTDAVLNISRNFGVASNKVAELIRLLTQTGLSFREAAKGAEVLARTSLLASFDNLRDTTEGLIALMNSFTLSTEDAGKGLEVINVLAKRFAVESGDIVEAIKRSGGAFKAAGGNLEELASLFTAVRSTSRESAETIATAFRTIFGRLQRPKTIEFFKELNIELADAEGNFIGPKNAIFAISDGLEKLGIQAGSIRFAEVAEQIGGIRQLSKVVPLLTQTAKARRALQVANEAEAESDQDVAKAKQTLGFQLAELTQNFRSLISEVMESSTFKAVAQVFLTIANAAVEIGRALKPLLPLFAVFGTVKLSQGLSSILNFVSGGGLKEVKEAGSGSGSLSGVLGFNRGGVVPGSGNSDTVPAMLTPGEFVIRKSAVQAFGAGNLGKINRYANGGMVGIKKVESTGDAFDGDTIGVKITPTEEPFPTRKTRLLGWDAFEVNRGTKEEKDKGKLAKQLANEYYKKGEDLTKEFTDPKNQGADKFNRFFWQDESFGKKLAEEGLAIPYSGSGKRATKMAKGGAVGTDTVPALLTPGEFVVNQKSAKAFGYANLSRINKYAKGGRVQRFQNGGEVPDGVPFSIPTGGTNLFDEPVQAFGDALERAGATTDQVNAGMLVFSQKLTEGATTLEALQAGALEAGLAASTVADAQEKHMKSMAAEFGRTGQTAPEGLTAGKELIQLDKFIQDATQALESNAQEVEALEAELSTLAKGTVDHAKKEKELADLLTRRKAVEQAVEGAEIEKERVKKESSARTTETNEVAEDGGSLAAAMKDVIPSTTALSTGLVGVNASLQSFGVELFNNQEALSAGAGQATAIDQYSKAIGDNAAKLGPKLEGWGKALEARGGKLGSFGKFLGKAGGVLAKFGPQIAKVGNVLGTVALAGTVAEGLFAKDFASISKKQQELGNVAGAGAAAQKAYAQELNRSIPVIGGFLNAFGADLTGFINTDIAKMEKSNAELVAATNRMAKVNEGLAKEIAIEMKEALREGDFDKISELTAQRVQNISEVQTRAESNIQSGSGLRTRFYRSDRARGTRFLESSAEGFASATKESQAAFNDLKPAIESFARNLAAQGLNQDEINAAIIEKFPSLETLIGGDIGKESQERAKKEAETLKERLETINYGLAQGVNPVNQKKLGAEQRANLEAEKKVVEAKLSEAESVRGLNVELQGVSGAALRNGELLAKQNAAYLEQITTTRDLNNEFRALSSKFAEADFQLEGIDSILSGKLTPDLILDSMGLRDVSSKDLSNLVQSGQQDNLIDAASLIGPQAQETAKKAVALQTGLNDFLDNPQNFLPDAGELKGVKDFDAKASEFIDSLIPEGSLGPAQRELLEKELSDAFASGDLSKVQAILERRLGEESGRVVEEIQGGLKKVAGLGVEVQNRYATFYQKEAELLDQRAALAREAFQKSIALEEERIGSLEAIGLKSKDALKKRSNLGKKELDGILKINKEQAAERKKRITDLVGAEISGTIMGGPIGKGASKAAEQERLRLESQTIDGATAPEIEAEIAARKKNIQNMIAEEQARRENTKALQEARGALAEELAFGTDEARASLLEDANVAATALSRGSMSGFTGEQRQQTQRFLDRFTGLGGDLGEQARKAKGRLGAQELFEQGVISADMIDQVADDIARTEQPIDQQVAKAIQDQYNIIEAKENNLITLKNQQINAEAEKVRKFGEAVDKFAATQAGKFNVSSFDEEAAATRRSQQAEADYQAATASADQRDAEREQLRKEKREIEFEKRLARRGNVGADGKLVSGQALYDGLIDEGFGDLLEARGVTNTEEGARKLAEISVAAGQKKEQGDLERREAANAAQFAELRKRDIAENDRLRQATRASSRAAENRKKVDARAEAKRQQKIDDSQNRASMPSPVLGQAGRQRGPIAPPGYQDRDLSGAPEILTRQPQQLQQPVPAPRKKPLSTEQRLERNLQKLRERKASPDLIAKREQELKSVKQRKAADAEKRTQKQQESQQQQVKVKGEHTVNVQGIELSNNVNSNRVLAKGLRVMADGVEGATTVKEQADAIRQGADIVEQEEYIDPTADFLLN